MSTHFFPRSLVILSLGIAVAGPSHAQDAARGDVVDAVTQCRALGDDAARLRCYDRASDRLATAQRNQDITVLTREEVATERKAGFGLPATVAERRTSQRTKLPPVETLDSTVARVATSGVDRFTVTLADTSVWRTTEWTAVDPRVGASVHIKRGAMGSYLGSFNGARSVRMTRVR